MKKGFGLGLLMGLILVLMAGCGGGGGGSRSGTLQITTNPTGVRVKLDGADTGLVTPATLSSVSPGAHTLSLEVLTGNTVTQTATIPLTVQAGTQTINFDFKLKGNLQVQPANTPAASNSIKVTVKQNGTLVGQSPVITRAGDAYTTTINQLPAGDVELTVVAYPNADGTGTPVAQVVTTTLVNPAQVLTARPTLLSTINRIEIVALSPALLVNEGKIFEGEQGRLEARAFNAADQPVVLKGTLQWQSSATAIATVEASGDDEAILSGVLKNDAPVTVTVNESESGKSATFTFTVIGFPNPPG